MPVPYRSEETTRSRGARPLAYPLRRSWNLLVLECPEWAPFFTRWPRLSSGFSPALHRIGGTSLLLYASSIRRQRSAFPRIIVAMRPTTSC